MNLILLVIIAALVVIFAITLLCCLIKKFFCELSHYDCCCCANSSKTDDIESQSENTRSDDHERKDIAPLPRTPSLTSEQLLIDISNDDEPPPAYDSAMENKSDS